MIRHIVMWDFKEEFDSEQNHKNALKIKAELEALPSIINGVISIEVIIEPLLSNNSDIMLNSLFDSEEALSNYQKNPHHNLVAKFIGCVTTNRRCIDYVD